MGQGLVAQCIPQPQRPALAIECFFEREVDERDRVVPQLVRMLFHIVEHSCDGFHLRAGRTAGLRDQVGDGANIPKALLRRGGAKLPEVGQVERWRRKGLRKARRLQWQPTYTCLSPNLHAPSVVAAALCFHPLECWQGQGGAIATPAQVSNASLKVET